MTHDIRDMVHLNTPEEQQPSDRSDTIVPQGNENVNAYKGFAEQRAQQLVQLGRTTEAARLKDLMIRLDSEGADLKRWKKTVDSIAL